MNNKDIFTLLWKWSIPVSGISVAPFMFIASKTQQPEYASLVLSSIVFCFLSAASYSYYHGKGKDK